MRGDELLRRPLAVALATAPNLTWQLGLSPDELLPAMLAAVFNVLEAHGPALQRVSTGVLAPEAVLES